MADPAALIRFLADRLAPCLLIFVASAFALPNDPSYSLVFYLLVVPATLAWYWQNGLSPVGNAAGRWAMLLVLWSAMTLLWGHDDGHRTLHFARDAAMTLVFVLALAASLRAQQARWRLGTVLIGCGTANAILAMAISVLGHPTGPRLVGWGATSNPVLGASVMIACYLTALYRLLLLPDHRGAYAAAASIMLADILLTESRGPLFSACAGTLIVCAASRWRWWVVAAMGGLACAWRLQPAAMRHHQVKLLVARGSSHHFEIWQRTLSLIADRPVFGHGLAANLDVPGLTFPHNLYLSLLFYSGAIGAALFAAMAAACSWRLWRMERGQERLWLSLLWLNGLLAGMTDLGQITKGPSSLWFIVWLPAGLLMATSTAPIAPSLSDRTGRPFSPLSEASLPRHPATP